MKVPTKMKALTGGEAVAEAIRQIEPEVMAAYPITPQTPIIEKYAKFVANGVVNTEYILAESEHSAMAAVIGAAAAGGRAMTATASVGLALMWEVLGVASGLRLPVVMAVANRTLSGPLNIHCDHSDSMGARDLGWIHIFSESAQEAYENTILAVRLAEDKRVRLPVMVMMDGFVTSHAAENVEVYEDETIKDFVGEYEIEHSLLEVGKPVTVGPVALPDYLTEIRRAEEEGMRHAEKVYGEVGAQLKKITGNDYPEVETYRTEGAEFGLVVLSSTAGTAKEVVDELREKGQKVGLVKPRLFRPFPYQKMAAAMAGMKRVAVLDRSLSFGADAPLLAEVKISLAESKKKPELQSCIFGLGGRDIGVEEISIIFEELGQGISAEPKWIDLRG